MKKSKEYSKDIIEAYILGNQLAVSNKVVDTIKSIWAEVFELKNTRNAKTDSAIIAILKEQNQKWKSICNKVNKEVPLLKEDGFLHFMQNQMPELYKLTGFKVIE
jgi:hypothetical protein